MDEHSLHSPFFYDLYVNVFLDKKCPASFPVFERLRKNLRGDNRTIEVLDLGAGSAHFTSNSRKVKDIAQTSLTPSKYSTLYFRLGSYINAGTILELGTSLGINTLYLSAIPSSRVFTLEGAPALADIAQTTFDLAEAHHITLVRGNIEKTLPKTLDSLTGLELAFMDANHRYEPTLRYFNWIVEKMPVQGAVVIDDIHYSREMTQAWKEIISHPLVYGSIDLYKSGIVFFDPALGKQHHVLWF